MDGKRCAGCGHWETPEDFKDRCPPGFGACKSEAFVFGYDANVLPANGVKVENDEGWAFYTGPAFGCVHWLAKSLKS